MSDARLRGFMEDANLAYIEQRCLGAVLKGGETWARFKADAEQRMGLPWLQIKDLLDERYAIRTKAAA